MARTPSNVVGFDDAPFDRRHRGDVRLVGAVCAKTRLDGVLSGKIRRHGRNSTRAMVQMVRQSQFAEHVRVVLLQGIAVGGFNVVDIHGLSEALEVPVLVVARRRPDLDAMRAFLKNHVPGWERKWGLIEAAGPMEPLSGVWVQRVNLSRAAAGDLLQRTTLHGKVPEALRVAHLIAGGVTTGTSRGRA